MKLKTYRTEVTIRKESNESALVKLVLLVVGVFIVIALIMNVCEPKCSYYGCDNEQASNSSYCYLHKRYSTSSSKNYSSNPYKSYDEGYEDVYDHDDYDWDRYYSDDDYADGVDDAMDELDW